eukprot:snap_masked-scaffold464_size163657-processed-gene-0.14 protein:Tk05279 transcript:snap_masked-scaffold464_size163657-processed-gene-0.14-mRNA-1 annotation:"ecdysone receptor a isoform"
MAATSGLKNQNKERALLAKQLRQCRICQDVILKHTCIHYGGLSCYSCRAFFRRANQASKKTVFQCKYEANCEITVKTRRKCQSCRYNLCLRAGMRPENVLTPDQKSVRFRKKRQKAAQPPKERLTILECKSPERPHLEGASYTRALVPKVEQPEQQQSQLQTSLGFDLPDIGDNIEDLLSNFSSGDSNQEPLVSDFVQLPQLQIVEPTPQSDLQDFQANVYEDIPVISPINPIGIQETSSSLDSSVDWFNHQIVEQKQLAHNYLLGLLNQSGIEH